MNEDMQVAPVKVGETYDVFINAVGEKGDGVAKIKGFVIFVANTKKGDYVRVKVTKVFKSIGFAEVVEKLEKPSDRRFATVTKEEFEKPKESEEYYEDTENFGEEE